MPSHLISPPLFQCTSLARHPSLRGKPLPRCPMYDATLTSNNGQSFLSGCGFDPYDTGCCNTGPGTHTSHHHTLVNL